jgi:hypothetical protein
VLSLLKILGHLLKARLAENQHCRLLDRFFFQTS